MNRASTISRQKAFVSGLLVWQRVVLALMLRDPVARHGHHGLGFYWIVGEPLLLTTGIIVLWSAVGFSHGHNISVATFGLTSYTFVTLWRHIVFRSIRAMGATAHLSYHRQIHPIDILIAWTLVELLGVLSGFLVSLTALYFYDSDITLRSPLLALGGFALTALFSMGVGMILAGLSEISESLHHLIQPVMYLTLPITGTFAMVSWLPQGVQKIIMYSPLVNCVEMIRAGVFPPEVETHFDVWYIVTVCCVLTPIGLAAIWFAGKRVQV